MGSSFYNASWRELLSAPPRACHVVQIYDSDAFLESAVAHFAAEGLQRGEAVVLTGTREHLAGVRGALEAKGIDVRAAERSGQLAAADAHATLDRLTLDGVLDTERFEAVACAGLQRARQDERFTGVRWWGEMTHLLYQRGSREDALQTEALADVAARQHGAPVFCSFLCDRFDSRAYEGELHDLCRTHSHFIPAEDYVRHRLAVNRAIADVLGGLDGSLLQSLSLWKGPSCDLPSSQAVLFWLREAIPERFEAVLERARAFQERHSSGRPKAAELSS